MRFQVCSIDSMGEMRRKIFVFTHVSTAIRCTYRTSATWLGDPAKGLWRGARGHCLIIAFTSAYYFLFVQFFAEIKTLVAIIIHELIGHTLLRSQSGQQSCELVIIHFAILLAGDCSCECLIFLLVTWPAALPCLPVFWWAGLLCLSHFLSLDGV